MRRRIISLTVLAALVSTVLFALPLGIAATRYYRDDTTTELERAADTVALAVSHALDAGLPPEVPPPGDEDDADREVGVYSPDGRLLAGHGPAAAGSIEQQAASATMDVVTGNEGDDLVLAVPVLSGSKVTGVVRAAMPSSTLTVRIALTLHGMALLAAAAIGASWLLARRFAKRLVRPLEELAAAAGRLGDGDFTVRSPRAGVPEIDQVGETLDATAARIGETLERERAFSAEASHQLRTPLTGLRLQLEAALETPGADPYAAIRAGIASADRLERTIEDLLALGRERRGQRAELNLDRLLDELRQAGEALLGPQGRKIRIVREDPPPARAAAAAVRQVLGVLMDNAATHGRGTVTVLARDAGDALAIDVADEGPDLGETDPFATAASGHGIGLRLARGLAEAEGGRLRLSRPDPPTFTLLLPAAPP
ncbi:two-component system histidine kinase [Amycolatopsis mediterranei S699]|uniref:histidine kinase n=3 Tax=Amycolatopsis mediterranei TaxID=33910 RepID=A0A0H3DD75_AMYMU|nr:HAMP domain-containing sensor histidine kinase [Amycolatopsis mediterranei]ADJ48661.1 two-component system histidine kinase [Amycolatopsis mediterranei U32]AEK45596.1 two-component system histidine kinase [Amycolatopsis mediterranei S699]AFO80370.1 two-component system histidine kinase [Amycolatopsis mediterranei S699]AGT87498.1 two-component system histidine kinase [Amycolatopsis mediterranei RB]KDO03877.1 histidine kinase [Amycolatopsis mediterranei]